MKSLLKSIIVLSALATALPALAQFAKPEDAIKYRKSAFFVMQQNFSRVASMAQGKTPFDAKVAAESAAVAESVSKLPWAGFGPGTDKGDTDAKPEIWTDRAKFNDYAEKMQAEMVKFNAAAKTGSLDAIKANLGGVGKTCKGCHDAFKS
jgi:cytochrome c556